MAMAEKLWNLYHNVILYWMRFFIDWTFLREMMLNSAKSILSRPQFSEPDKTRVAQLVWAMTLIFFFGTIAVCASFAYFIPEESWLSLTIFVVVSLFTLATLWFLQQKKNQSCWQYIHLQFFIWGCSSMPIFYGGIRNINGAAFIILLIISGLLLGTRVLLRYLGISVATITTLYFLEIYGLLENTALNPIQPTDLVIVKHGF